MGGTAASDAGWEVRVLSKEEVAKCHEAARSHPRSPKIFDLPRPIVHAYTMGVNQHADYVVRASLPRPLTPLRSLTLLW